MLGVGIGERLKEFRIKKGLKIDEVADALELARSTYASYETGRRKPQLETIIALADFHNTSSDYIIGITDNPVSKKDDNNFKKYMMTHKHLNWNGVPLTEEELKPIKDLLEIVVRDRLPEKIEKSRHHHV